MKISEGKQRK